MAAPSHIEGNLNFTATRNGWTRNFTLSPEEVSKIDYSTLETVLELQTIKAFRTNLRVYVEHPAGSGTYIKVRPWKHNDGTLNSALLQEFFEERMQSGTVTNIDVRDGQDPVKQAGKAGDWLRAHGLSVTTPSNVNGATTSEGEVTEDAQANAGEAPKPQGSGFFGSFFRSGNTSQSTSTPTTPAPEENPPLPADPAETEKREEEILRERGWQPMLRRLTTKKRKAKKEKDAADIQAEGDGEEIQIPDGEEANAMPDKNGKWRKYSKFGKGKKDKEKEKEKADDAEPAAQDPAAQGSEAPPTPEKETPAAA
ncbi:hypothetical protein V5O48_000579 [Marasmius crinis-equi]|uniref:Uncharacterized protein n=1 Tax=Marasmius crinis-equi TaxID=585013 RepID=A0ABR3G0S3_9AGAR